MGLSASKPKCPVCGSCEVTLYLMENSPYVCTQCDTEWDQLTGTVLYRRVIASKQAKLKEEDFTRWLALRQSSFPKN